MYSYKKQRGLGAIGWLCVLVLLGFFGTCAFKMVPAYTENQLVESALKSLAEEPESVHQMSKSEIKQKLNTFYTINNVRGKPTESLEIERLRDKTLVKVNYEVRAELFANVSVVMTFNNVLDSSNPEACC